MEKTPLISICIPTYNRSHILSKTLGSIVRNSEFDEDVEIVISDNCSTDNTEAIAKSFADRYNNVKYYRNRENIRDANFWYAVNRASGQYIKLQGDQYTFTDNGLAVMKTAVRKHLDDKQCVFFTNDFIYAVKGLKNAECRDVNDYLKYVSTYMTSINLFGIWKEDIDLIKDPLEEAPKKIPQVDWTLKLLVAKKRSSINNQKICILSHDGTIPREIKYDWFEIHVKNYYDILYKFLQRKGVRDGISDKALANDKINCIKHFRQEFFRTFVFPQKEYTYDKRNTLKILDEYCGEVALYKKYKKLLPISYLAYPYFVFRYTENGPKRALKKMIKITKHK